VDRDDMSRIARDLGCEYFHLYDLSEFKKINIDIIILSVSIISFEEVLKNIDSSVFKGKLIIDVLSVKMHAKSVMLNILP
jgi:prephenate dehydrogenase